MNKKVNKKRIAKVAIKVAALALVFMCLMIHLTLLKIKKSFHMRDAAREAYSSVDQDGNVLYYEGMVPNDYDLSWNMMLSYLNDSERQIFDEVTEASFADLPDNIRNIRAYLGYAALRFNETNHIEDVYSLDLEQSIVKNINSDIITYELQGQFSELEVTVDLYNGRVHLEKSRIY